MGALQLPQYEPDYQYEPDQWPAEPEPARPAPVPPTAPRRRPLRRLTRAQALRRRRLVVLVVASAVLLAAVAGGRELAPTEPSPPLEPLALVEDGAYVVQPGDTLWTIAQRLAPDEDPRRLVADLRSRHGDVELQVGDRLDVGPGRSD